MKHLQNIQQFLYFEEKYGKEVGYKLIKTMEIQTKKSF